MKALSILPFVILLAWKSSSASERPPPYVSVNADIGVIVVGRSELTTKILGVYGRKGLNPKISIDITHRDPCTKDRPEACGAFSSISYSYESVDELITSLIEAESNLARGKKFQRKMVQRQIECPTRDNFRGTVSVDPIARTLLFAMHAGDPIILSEVELRDFLSQLEQARDIIRYLHPKFDAFNSAAPDSSVSISLDRLDFYKKQANPAD